jgi:membrane fusion protein (multidrug efflux system)
MTGALSACRNGLGGLLALAALAACQGEAGETPDTAPVPAAAIAVEALSIAADGAGSGVRASGLVAYKREAALGFGAPGQIETLSVDAGDRVAAGQVIATLRKISVGADEAESALARQTAQQNFDRVTRLFEAGASSQAELDSARLALERTRERISIIAPSGGVVLARQAEPGQTVSAGQPVVTIGENRAGLVVRASMTPAEWASRRRHGVRADREARAGFALSCDRAARIDVGTFELKSAYPASRAFAGEVAEISLAARSCAGALRLFRHSCHCADRCARRPGRGVRDRCRGGGFESRNRRRHRCRRLHPQGLSPVIA